MRGVIPMVTPEILAWRLHTGVHRWDEIWEGVWHLMPSPNWEHRDLEGELYTYLRSHWARPRGAKVYIQINLAAPGGWPENYRIPDLLLVSPQRFAIDCDEYFEGAPDAVVEIHSPDDEAYEKRRFYAELGVPEVWIIHRDTKVPEIYLLRNGRYRKQRANGGGWVRSPGTGVELRAGKPGKLAIRMNGDEGTRADLPEG
jgi:Uma2 family endonuclease